ncbi:MAG: hypothetical protein NTU98_09130 [Bacteroidetes bacterium]|nr:hypothetical protein [Bacteroidota bacterium]
MRHHPNLAALTILSLFPFPALAQHDSPHVQFHGSNTLFGQYSNMQGVGQEMPPSFYRNELRMTLTVYDVPVSATFFITSLQSDYRQSINNFRIYLDVAALMKTKKGEASAKKGAMSKTGRFLTNFSALEFGKCRPNYTELTLKGISLSGANIEFTPGWFYMAFATGKVKRPINSSATVKPTYKQNLIFGKMGFGRKKGTHFYLTYMQAKDKVSSLPEDPGMDTMHVKPRSNHVAGTELRLAFFKKKFTIDGEAAVSMLTRNTESPGVLSDNSDVPKWLNDLLKPNMSSSVDYAYDVRSTLTLKTTTIMAGVRMVGPGYVTLGNPNLVNDRMTYEGRIDQTFARNQVSISAFYRQHNDNLVNWKTGRSTTIAYGLVAGFRFRKLPYLHCSYTPFLMSTASEAYKLENSVRVITASASHNYKIGSLRSNTMFSFYHQETETILDSLTMKSRNNTYTLNQEIAFKFPLSLVAGVSFTQSGYSGINQNILLLTISGTYSAFRNKWQNSLGVKYSNQDYEQDKLGFFLNSRIQLWSKGDLDIRVEKNTFHDSLLASNNFDEWIVQSTFIVKW